MNKNEHVVSKGDLMRLVYTKEELKNIDSAIPVDLWEEYPPIGHIMNYNNSVFGKCENLFDVAKERGIEVPHWFNRIKNEVNERTRSRV